MLLEIVSRASEKVQIFNPNVVLQIILFISPSHLANCIGMIYEHIICVCIL